MKAKHLHLNKNPQLQWERHNHRRGVADLMKVMVINHKSVLAKAMMLKHLSGTIPVKPEDKEN